MMTENTSEDTKEILPDSVENEAQDLSLQNVKSILEALLFSCNEPISADKLAKIAGNISPKVAFGLLQDLKHEYNSRECGLQIVEIAGGFQMATRPHLGDWILKLQKQRRRTILSPATLETLAIVAYKQPVTRAEVEAIRGVEASAPLRTLAELNIITVSGKKDVVGRPPLYVTTDLFLKIFGLNSLSDLPSIPELKEMFAGQYSWFGNQENSSSSGEQFSYQLEPALFGVQPVLTEDPEDETSKESKDDVEKTPPDNVDDLFD